MSTRPETCDLTIAIPTFNRAFYVEQALKSLQQQHNATNRWRVLVVDNNSTDSTPTTLQEIAASWQRLGVVHEVRPGASIARNRASEMTQGKYVLYVDDECKFPEDYVDRALKIIDVHEPMMFGGPIHPWYVSPPPHWFRPEYGSYSLPWATGLADRISLSAGNMGFAVDALRDVGGFNQDLGPRGMRMAYGEETDLEARILRRFGASSVYYDPEFYNLHAVRPEKYLWRNIIREHFQRGSGRATIGLTAGHSGAPTPTEVPPTLRPQAHRAAPPNEPMRWQNIAFAYGLGIVRRAGYYWALAQHGVNQK